MVAISRRRDKDGMKKYSPPLDCTKESKSIDFLAPLPSTMLILFMRLEPMMGSIPGVTFTLVAFGGKLLSLIHSRNERSGSDGRQFQSG